MRKEHPLFASKFVSKEYFYPQNLLTIFFCFSASDSSCVFFPKFAFLFASCPQGSFGVCDPGVIKKLENREREFSINEKMLNKGGK